MRGRSARAAAGIAGAALILSGARAAGQTVSTSSASSSTALILSGARAAGQPVSTMGSASRRHLILSGARAAGQPPAAGRGGAVTFTDVTRRAGIDFRHDNGAAGAHRYPELFGGGVAVLDLDGDRWPDLLFVNGRDWEAGAGTRHGLFRNNRDGTFADVFAGSGLDGREVYGLGAAVADYDNDGDDDVFMTTVDGGRLYRNAGGGAFDDVTAAAGVGDGRFAVSAAWVDYDRDGLVDLFVGNYVDWSPKSETVCGNPPGYCGPDAYGPVAPALYRNAGGGRFRNVTARAGLDDPTDKAMGVAVLDYDADGWPDVFVGSDRVPAKLYRNDGGGGFTDHGLRAGVALSERGRARANMGVDAADYDRSGRPDILVGNFLHEMLGLYRDTGDGFYVDAAPRTPVGRASYGSVTWAVFFLDVDLDGHLDVFAANGGTDESQGMLDSRARIRQPPLLLRNLGGGAFEDVTAAAGEAFGRPVMGRGAAYADFDGDGDLDLVLTELGGPARLLRNDRGNRNHWLRVRPVGVRSNRGGIGAVVRVVSASGRQERMVRSGSSYASQSELPLTFGLGPDARVESLEVAWPSGVTQRFTDVAADQRIVVDETAGLRPDPRIAGR